MEDQRIVMAAVMDIVDANVADEQCKVCQCHRKSILMCSVTLCLLFLYETTDLIIVDMMLIFFFVYEMMWMNLNCF